MTETFTLLFSNALTFTFLESLKLDLSLSVIKEGNRLHVSFISNTSFPFTNVTFIILEAWRQHALGKRRRSSAGGWHVGMTQVFLQIPSIVSSSSLPYRPRHWGQGFSRAGEDGVDDGSTKRKDDSLFPLLLLEFCQTEHFWDDSLGFVSLSCSPHLQQSTFRDSLK